MSSKNAAIRDFWLASRGNNIKIESMLESLGFQGSNAYLKKSQSKESVSHFLGLKSQGLSAKMVSEAVLSKNISSWKQSLDVMPAHFFNLLRKAMANQLPTLKILKCGDVPTLMLAQSVVFVSLTNMFSLTVVPRTRCPGILLDTTRS